MQKFRVKLAAAVTLASLLLPSIGVAEEAQSSSAGKQFLDNGAVWLITEEGCRKAYTSQGAFESFGFNSFVSIQKGTSADLAIPDCAEKFILPREGSVIFSSNKEDYGTGYLITNGKKRGFTNFNVFEKLGFKDKKKQWADVSFIGSGDPIASETESHAEGTLVDDKGTFIIVHNEGNIGIPDETTLKSWGYKFEDAVPANDADRKYIESSVLTSRKPGQLHGRDLIQKCIAFTLANAQHDTSTTPGQAGSTGTTLEKPLPPNCPPPPCLRVLENKTQESGQAVSNTLYPINCGKCEVSQTGSGTVQPQSSGSTRPGCFPPPCKKGDSTSSSEPTAITEQNGVFRCFPPCPVPLQNSTGENQSVAPTGTKPSCIPIPPPCKPMEQSGSGSQMQTGSTTNTSDQKLKCLMVKPHPIPSGSGGRGYMSPNSQMPLTMTEYLKKQQQQTNPNTPNPYFPSN